MIPSGATHQCHIGEYWDFEAVPVPLVWRGGEWMKDDSNWARIWTKLESVGKIRRQPKRIRKPTHVYMGELFLLDGSSYGYGVLLKQSGQGCGNHLIMMKWCFCLNQIKNLRL